MAGEIRIEMNGAGVKALLQSPEVQADLRRRADAVQQAAGGAPDYSAIVVVGKNRAAAYVATASTRGRRAEAEDRALLRALDAARG